jgi:hypothetical protein
MGRYSVRAQGIDAAVRRATGDDTEVSLGQLDEAALRELVGRMLALPNAGGECPPHLMVDGAAGTVSVIIEDGVITASSGDARLTPDQLLARITGSTPSKPEPQRHEFPRGMKPVRRAELPPTQPRVMDDPRLIDTSARCAEVTLWKGRGASAASWFLLWCGVLMAVLGVLMRLPGPGGRAGGGAFFAIAVVLVVLHVVVKSTGRERCAVGVDWKTNTLWLSRPSVTLAFEPHASCITDAQPVELRVGDGIRFADGGMPHKRGSSSWLLQLRYTDGHQVHGLRQSFLSRSDAAAVAEASRAALAG